MKRYMVACCLLVIFSTVANAKILFDSKRNGMHGVYVMDDDGSNVTLLDAGKNYVEAAWAPNGKLIAFDRHKTGIFLMNADGTNKREILEYDANVTIGSPTFTPDSKYLVYKRIDHIPPTPKTSINIMNIATSEIRKISEVNAASLDVSPDGRHIVYSTSINIAGGGNNLYIMDMRGNIVRELLSPGEKGEWNFSRGGPRWSPNGKHILYDEDEFSWKITPENTRALIRKGTSYIICDLNGKTVKELNIPKNWVPWGLEWMDDGKSVILGVESYPLNAPPPKPPYPPINIYKYDIDTSNITQITDNEWDDTSPLWISDDVLSVSPKAKKTVQWGQLKTFLNTRYKTLKTFSSGLSDFLLQH